MESLAHLSDDDLVAQLQECCFNIRRFTVRALRFLGEVQERRIYLKAAASSMFDYTRRFMSMSHGQAYRFVCGARLCRQYPFLLERIERGELHLSTLAHIASFITPENVHQLVEQTANKNRADVDLVLRDWFGVEPTHGRAASPFPYDIELLEMARRAKDLLSHDIPDGNMLEISKMAYRLLIEHLEKKKRGKADKPRPAATEQTKGISRHATREMFERDGDQCSYVDERTGARCPSRAFIQRDHRHERARGGSNDAENLRPLCAAHNLFLAELAFGRDYVERRIRRRRTVSLAKVPSVGDSPPGTAVEPKARPG
jgi:hypothetical protein